MPVLRPKQSLRAEYLRRQAHNLRRDNILNTQAFTLALSADHIETVTQVLYYLVFTINVCLFVDLSPLQKYPMCKFNYALAAGISALPPFAMFQVLTFSSPWVQHIAGAAVATVASIVISLQIQKVIPIDIDF